MSTPFDIAARPSRRSIAPGVCVLSLMLGCGAWRDYAMDLRNDTSTEIGAHAQFQGGAGGLSLPAGASTHFSSSDPFDVVVTLPDGTHRTVRVQNREQRTDIRIVEGQQPFTVYMNGR